MIGKKQEPGTHCPMLNKTCIERKCAWYMLVRGANPNTGEEVDNWGCAVAWLPVLTIENSQQQRQTGAAVESFRNEMVKSNELHLRIQAASLQQNLIDGSDKR